jgi:hypothetical protein
MSDPTTASAETPLDLDTLRKLAEAATDGPWHACDDPWNGKPLIYAGSRAQMFAGSVIRMTTPKYHEEQGYECSVADVAFIVAAREAVPALIAEVERLRALEAAVGVENTIALLDKMQPAAPVLPDADLEAMERALQIWRGSTFIPLSELESDPLFVRYRAVVERVRAAESRADASILGCELDRAIKSLPNNYDEIGEPHPAVLRLVDLCAENRAELIAALDSSPCPEEGERPC